MRKNFTPSRCCNSAASRERNTGSGSVSQAGDYRTNLLQVEAAGGRHGDRGTDPTAIVGRREQETEPLVADLTLDKHMLQEVPQTNILTSGQTSGGAYAENFLPSAAVTKLRTHHDATFSTPPA